MADLIKKLAARLDRAPAGSDQETSILYEVFEALSRALHRYEILSVDRLYESLTDPVHTQQLHARASARGSALWGLRELLRSFLALFPSPVEPLARWDLGSFMGQLIAMVAEAPGSITELRARLGAPMGTVEAAVAELRARGLLIMAIGPVDHVELSDAGLRVNAYLHRAHHSPLREIRRERYGSWSDRAEKMLDDPETAEIDQIYRLLWEFGPAFELARRDADSLPRSPSIDQLLGDLRQKLSVKRVAELELSLLTQPELEQREAQLPERSTIWVAGVERPNGSVFRKTVSRNIGERGCTYIYLCSRASFEELRSYVEKRAGPAKTTAQLLGLSATPICGAGRFYNVTSSECGSPEGWMAHWIGRRDRPDAPKGGAFYSRVGDEYLTIVAERFWRWQRQLRQASESWLDADASVLPL